MAESIQKLQKKDLLPERPVLPEHVQGPSLYAAMRTNEANKFTFRAEMDDWIQRKRNLDERLYQAYSYIFMNHCDKTIQERIEQHPDFDAVIRGNPIALLKYVKVLMVDPETVKNPFISLIEQLSRLLNIRQHRDEPLIDFTSRVKQERDNTLRHVGKNVFDVYVSHTPEYLQAEREGNGMLTTELKNTAFEKFMACVMLRGVDQSKYGSLNTHLHEQYAMGIDQYPKTMLMTISILKTHRPDKSQASPTHNNNDTQQIPNVPTSLETSFAQGQDGPRCYCCGDPSHKSPQCNFRDDIAQKDWFRRTGKVPAQVHASVPGDITSNNKDSDDGTEASFVSGLKSAIQLYEQQHEVTQEEKRPPAPSWMNLQINLMNKERTSADKMRKWILLDSASTCSLFGTQEYVYDIKPSVYPLELLTNAGNKACIKDAIVPDFGSVWFDKDAITNIFSLAELCKRFRVTFDSAEEDAFLIRKPSGEVLIRFKKSPEGLYYYEPSDNFVKQVKAL